MSVYMNKKEKELNKIAGWIAVGFAVAYNMIFLSFYQFGQFSQFVWLALNITQLVALVWFYKLLANKYRKLAFYVGISAIILLVLVLLQNFIYPTMGLGVWVLNSGVLTLSFILAGIYLLKE